MADSEVTSDNAKKPSPRLLKWGCGAGGCLLSSFVGFVILFFLALAGAVVPIQFVSHMLLGWYWFIERWAEVGQIVWSDIWLAGACLVILMVGLHRSANWLVRRRHECGDRARSTENDIASEDSSSPQSITWRWKWTFGMTLLMLIFCVSGIAALGIMHQWSWFRGTDQRLIQSNLHEFTGRLGTKKQLVKIGEAFVEYDKNWSAGDHPNGDGGSTEKYRQSWIVSLLPWLGPDEDSLAQQLRRDVAWNDPANHEILKTAIPMLHGEFSGRTETVEGFATAHCAANIHATRHGEFLRIREFTDGATCTLLVGETRFRHKAWGDPTNLRDPTLGLSVSPNGFGSQSSRGVVFLRADGSVKDLDNDIAPEILKALSTPASGDELPDYYCD